MKLALYVLINLRTYEDIEEAKNDLKQQGYDTWHYTDKDAITSKPSGTHWAVYIDTVTKETFLRDFPAEKKVTLQHGENVYKPIGHLESANLENASDESQPTVARDLETIATKALQHPIDRAKTYDQEGGERSAGRVATAFNAVTGHNIKPSEVYLLLQLLKDVRQWSNQNEYHQDSAEDAIAYAALKAEALEIEYFGGSTKSLVPKQINCDPKDPHIAHLEGKFGPHISGVRTGTSYEGHWISQDGERVEILGLAEFDHFEGETRALAIVDGHTQSYPITSFFEHFEKI